MAKTSLGALLVLFSYRKKNPSQMAAKYVDFVSMNLNLLGSRKSEKLVKQMYIWYMYVYSYVICTEDVYLFVL